MQAPHEPTLNRPPEQQWFQFINTWPMGEGQQGFVSRNLEFKKSLKHYISQTVSWDWEWASFLKYKIGAQTI